MSLHTTSNRRVQGTYRSRSANQQRRDIPNIACPLKWANVLLRGSKAANGIAACWELSRQRPCASDPALVEPRANEKMSNTSRKRTVSLDDMLRYGFLVDLKLLVHLLEDRRSHLLAELLVPLLVGGGGGDRRLAWGAPNPLQQPWLLLPRHFAGLAAATWLAQTLWRPLFGESILILPFTRVEGGICSLGFVRRALVPAATPPFRNVIRRPQCIDEVTPLLPT